ncbi:MAG: M15 family metallopeptidase [Gemmatimonadota bacterium]|nr:M15 family metallopeptidase [Gemmatimonadota bacterium]
MSAGASGTARVDNDITLLAPKFSEAVIKALALCESAGIDAVVYEANRSAELQELYYCRGRTVLPPRSTVTNARSNLFSWHGYGLAVDVIHRIKQWDVSEAWFASVAEHFIATGCRWGGEWKMKDLPHFQWGLCKPSPSDNARAILLSRGREAVWDAVSANANSSPSSSETLVAPSSRE